MTEVKIYRQDVNSSNDYFYVGTIPQTSPATTTFTDTLANGSLGSQLEEGSLDQVNYSYFVTYYRSSEGYESRPTSQSVNVPITNDNRRIILNDLPTRDDIPDGNPDNLTQYGSTEM